MFKLCKRFFNKYLGNSQRYTAFTLAEVLITLGIIGVVAAMTILTLISNTQKHDTVVKLKKSYTILAQAIKLAEIDNGSVSSWDYSNAQNFYTTYLKPYLIVNKEYIGVAKPENITYTCLNNQLDSAWSYYD